MADVINDFRCNDLRLDDISPLWGHQLLPRMRVPYTYLWSEALIPKPPDWDDHIKIAGFSFLEQASSYTPPQDLADFLAAGPTPIYIGFGSIVIDDPAALTTLIYDAIKIAGVRAIVSKGWSGLGSTNNPDSVYLAGNIPHDWLFTRVSAVVHHGGAGTCAIGVSLGRPTIVVPFFGDQPFWGQMIAKAGAGPVPVPFKEMTAQSLAESITYALQPKVQIAVQEMAQQISKEDGARAAADDWEQRADLPDYSCDLYPERLAIWEHKKTKARLSGFAVSCLIQSHAIDRKEVKLIKRTHWYVDEGAEYPFLATVATFTAFVRSIQCATSSYRRKLKKRPEQATSTTLDEVDIEKQARPRATRAASVVEGKPEEWRPGRETITPAEIEKLARQAARKTRRDRLFDMVQEKFGSNEDDGSFWEDEKSHGRAVDVSKATACLAFEIFLSIIHVPANLMYNLANGFHNMPSYMIWSVDVRHRDEITGLGSGLRTAAKEFILGYRDAFGGLIIHPYRGAKKDGLKGALKGAFTGVRGLGSNIMAANCGLPGYACKGLEKEFAKRRLTRLKAELLLIRLRQGIEEYLEASLEERLEAVRRWKTLGYS